MDNHSTKEEYWQNYANAIKDDSIVLLGDITPSNGYATLVELFEYSDKLLELGLTAKPVLTLRDPITQIVSQTQFQKSIPKNLVSFPEIGTWVESVYNNTASYNQEHLNSDIILRDGLTAFYTDVPTENWPTWENTITNYLTVFGSVYIQFFEEMFSENETASLQNWLGLEYKPMNYTDKVFSFPSPNELSEEEKKKVFSTFPKMKENYDYAVNVWGQEKIDSIWWNPYK